jgi:flagellar hook-length control protein FliK
VVRAARELRLAGQQEIEFDLDPPSLGRISVRLDLGGGRAAVTIRTDLQPTARELRQAASQVESALGQQGLALERFDVRSSTQQGALPAMMAELPGRESGSRLRRGRPLQVTAGRRKERS